MRYFEVVLRPLELSTPAPVELGLVWRRTDHDPAPHTLLGLRRERMP